MAESVTGFVCTDNPELLEAPAEPVRVEGIEPWAYPESTWRVSIEPPGVRFPDGFWIAAEYDSAVRSLQTIGDAGWLNVPADAKPDPAWRVLPGDFRMEAGKVYDFIHGVREGVTYRWYREALPPEPYPEAALTWDDHDGIEGDD